MSEESKPTPAAKKAVFNVVSTSKYCILSNESVVIEITSGGRAKTDGVKFEIGVSLKDIRENALRRKLEKRQPRLAQNEIDSIIDKTRGAAVGSYKQEVLDKLTEVGAEESVLKAVEKELKLEHIARMIK